MADTSRQSPVGLAPVSRTYPDALQRRLDHLAAFASGKDCKWYSLENAITIATTMHEGQYRRGSNEPYICHPMRVMMRFPLKMGMEYGVISMLRIVAIMHDVFEDTEYTLDEFTAHWIGPDEVIPALDAITRRKPASQFRLMKDETHSEYIDRCAQNDIAVSVKIADTLDNLADPHWCPTGMVKRYRGVLAQLTGVAYERQLWIPE